MYRLVQRIAIYGALMFFAFSVFTSAARDQSSSPSIELRVVSVTRKKVDQVEVSFTLANLSGGRVFVPVIDVPGLHEPWALDLFHFERGRGWGSLGPFHDVPTDMALPIDPKTIVSFKHSVHDPCIVVFPDKHVPHHRIAPTGLSGTYKIRVGYYLSESDWKKRLSVIEGKTSYKQMPDFNYTESETFTIAPGQ